MDCVPENLFKMQGPRPLPQEGWHTGKGPSNQTSLMQAALESVLTCLRPFRQH